jgi:hypothetical protein
MQFFHNISPRNSKLIDDKNEPNNKKNNHCLLVISNTRATKSFDIDQKMDILESEVLNYQLFRGKIMIIEDSIEINASAENVFNCLLQNIRDKESYRAWHSEHKDIQWLKGPPLSEGSIMYIEEYLQGFLLKQKYKIIKIVPNKEIKYRVLFPLSLIAPENKFYIKTTGENSCIFTAMGKINMPTWLFYRLHKSHKHKLEASKQHMKEEGKNLKKAAEQL